MSVDDPAPELRPGMTAEVVVTTDILKNALWVPAQAIFESDGRTFVYVPSGSGFAPRDVKLVRRSETQAVVTGLAANQAVALASPEQQTRKAAGHTGALEGSVVVAVGGSENLLVEKLDNGKYATAAESADSGPGKHQYSTETVAELPIRSATDQAVAQRYLTAAGLGPMAGFNDLPNDVKNSLPIPNLADPKEASEAFVKATGEHGFVTKQTFDDSNSTSYGGVFDAEEIVKLSGGISFDKVGRKSTGLKYWDGSKMVPKTGCGEK